jgi:hypothetical protein
VVNGSTQSRLIPAAFPPCHADSGAADMQQKKTIGHFMLSLLFILTSNAGPQISFPL